MSMNHVRGVQSPSLGLSAISGRLCVRVSLQLEVRDCNGQCTNTKCLTHTLVQTRAKQLQLGPVLYPDKEGGARHARQTVRACNVPHLHAVQRQEP
jgi:hypothetical protein